MKRSLFMAPEPGHRITLMDGRRVTVVRVQGDEVEVEAAERQTWTRGQWQLAVLGSCEE